MKRIGDILTRHKTPVLVEDDVIYQQVTIRTNYKGVVLRGTQSGSTIGTKNQWRVSAGQFILSRIDARNGAFGIIPEELEGAIVTNDFLAFDINDNEVEREFFNVFLQSPVFLDACIKASRGNTNRKRVDESFFLNFEVNLPPLAEQHELITRINKARATLNAVKTEIAHQQSLLTKLKQAILQEAIQGKLTEDWRAANPDVEPASELLKRIQAEKARLVAAKKIRPEKLLPRITPEEIPFEIPNGWEWCRLGEIAEEITKGSSPTWQGIRYVDESAGGILFVTSKNVGTGEMLFEKKSYVETRFNIIEPRSILQKNDILTNLVGASIARTALFDLDCIANINQAVALIRIPEGFLNKGLLVSYMNSSVGVSYILEKRFAPGRANLSLTDLAKIPIPLPPLAEQVAIVERVESLMATCRELEAEIEKSRSHAEHLLQAVLKEAFVPSE